MHAERDELIKRTFPQLRKLCAERGVTLTEVDLRWRITEEHVHEPAIDLLEEKLSSYRETTPSTKDDE